MPETETLKIFVETRPRRDIDTYRDRDIETRDRDHNPDQACPEAAPFHHDRFSRFCRAYGDDRETDKTDRQTNRPHLATAAIGLKRN